VAQLIKEGASAARHTLPPPARTAPAPDGSCAALPHRGAATDPPVCLPACLRPRPPRPPAHRRAPPRPDVRPRLRRDRGEAWRHVPCDRGEELRLLCDARSGQVRVLLHGAAPAAALCSAARPMTRLLHHPLPLTAASARSCALLTEQDGVLLLGASVLPRFQARIENTGGGVQGAVKAQMRHTHTTIANISE
jgi:hypothetical protein